jgi:hypothetical protein
MRSASSIRPSSAALLAVSALLTLTACPEPQAPPPGPPGLVTDITLPGLVEVVPCKHSHEHDLRHVQIFADPGSATLFQTCVLDQGCDEPFPVGSLFVKREYEFEGCKDEDLRSVTASLKLEAGELPEGGDWQWQRLDTELRVVEDGAPPICLICHIDHCSPPYGHDLRCIPD